MKRKLWTILALAVIISMIASFSLIGCKEAAAEETTEEEVVVEETTEEEVTEEEVAEEGNWIGQTLKYNLDAEVAGGEEVELNLWFPPGFLDDYWPETAAMYKEIHPNVTINVVPFDTTAPEKMLLAATNGDVNMVTYQYSYAEPLENLYYMLPDEFIDAYSQDTVVGDFGFETTLGTDEKVGARPGIQTDGMMYNTKIWEDMGYTKEDLPTTWDEMIEIALEANIFDENGTQTRIGYTANAQTHPMYITLLFQQGVYFASEQTGHVNFDTPESLNALEMIYDWYYEDKICDPLLPIAQDLFGSGSVLFKYGFGWQQGFFNDNFPDLDFNWFPALGLEEGVTPPCYGRGQSEAMVILDTTDIQNEVTLDFYTWLYSNDERIIKMCQGWGLVPYKTSIADIATDYFDEDYVDAFFFTLDRKVTVTERGVPSRGVWNKDFVKTVNDMITSNISPADTALKLQTDADFAYEGKEDQINLEVLKDSHAEYKYNDEMKRY